MTNKTTKLERGLLAGSMFCSFIAIYAFRFHTREGFHMMGITELFFGLYAISKVGRFYKQANKNINTIWIISTVLILSASIMDIFNFGALSTGIAGVGICAFNFTWFYSFLQNKPEIQ